MALVFTTLPPIYPVYSDNLILSVSESGATSNHYYRFDVYINAALQDSFNCPADPTTYAAAINLSTILSTYFESNTYTPTTINLIETDTAAVVPYYVIASLYSSGNTLVCTAQTSTYYVFNGCVNAEEVFDITDYLINSGSTGRFLTNWHTDRSLTMNDYGYLQVLHGNYGTGYVSQFGGISITRHQFDGSTQTITESYTGTSKGIINIDISPKSINVWNADFINDNTEYYLVEEINGYTLEPLRVDIIREKKLTKFYNFNYVNRRGGMDFFTAVKVSENKYKIKKSDLEQYSTRKVYYTNTERTTTVLTQFLSAYQAEKLQELFNSPAVSLWFNDKMNSVKIVNSIVVPDRYPKDKFIQYEIEFEYNNRYYTQQF